MVKTFTQVLKLSRLGENEVRNYLSNISDLTVAESRVKELLATTGGNPLFMKELVQLLQSGDSDESVECTRKLTHWVDKVRFPMAHYFLVNHELKLIIAFSPKCACQTIRSWFQACLGENAMKNPSRPGLYSIKPQEIRQHDDYLKVFFVRDPLRRLVSFYANWVVRNNHLWCFADKLQRFSLEDRTFRKFLYALQHLHVHELEFQHHLLPQLDNVSVDDFQRVVLVESLDKGLQELNHELGNTIDFRSHNRSIYATQLNEPVVDRIPQWLRDHGVPPAGWFYDHELHEIASSIYDGDIEFFQQSGGDLLTPSIKT